MSMESDLVALLKTICTRTFPDVAPPATAMPYVTRQGIGGEPLRNLDNTASDKRHTLMQINGWAATRAQSLTMVRQIEDALCGSGLFIAKPQGEPLSTYEPDAPAYGSLQRFDIIAAR